MLSPGEARHIDTVNWFVSALILFLVSHSVPAIPPLRARLVALLGETLYLLLYAAISFAVLGWLILAARYAPYIPLWTPQLGFYWFPILLMPFAIFLLVGGALAPNPLSIALRRKAFRSDRPGIVGVTRHPILWGLTIWSVAHVPPNGDLVSVIMFGGFAAFALLSMPLIDRRRKRALGHDWQSLAERTSLIPFAGIIAGRARHEWPPYALPLTLVLTIAVYAAMLSLHATLLGPDPLAVLP
jgi:uncharacterized membrane protein